MYCVALYWIALFYIGLYCTEVCYATVHCITLRFVVVNCVILRCAMRGYCALNNTALHCTGAVKVLPFFDLPWLVCVTGVIGEAQPN